MKFALAHTRKSMKRKVVISFFFNARGSNLEKSTLGMYRSLLLQLLTRLPELQVVFESLELTNRNISSDYSWSIESLKYLFQLAVQSLGQHEVLCFVDALDECDQSQVRDMVSFFQLLGDVSDPLNIRFRVFFSSRHYPYITITRGLSFVLEGQEGHDQDMANYINSELRIGQSPLAGRIRANIQTKSAGVFMWVVLVVDMLNQEHDNGLRERRLLQKLDEIPGDLHALFRDILTRDSHNRYRLLLCIQWLLFAHRPLTPTELYFAILSGTEPGDLSAYDSSDMPPDAIERFILSSSKGLAEVTKSKIPTVQFIHESVRDFLLKENGLREVWSNLGGEFAAQSHEKLKSCCLAYLAIDVTAHIDIDDPLPRAASAELKDLRHDVAKAFPFLQYATENLLRHADGAQAGGIYQGTFLREFDRIKWLRLGNIFKQFDIRRYTPATSLLYILGEQNLPALIRVSEETDRVFVVEDGRYGPPLFAALACRNFEAGTAMLKSLEQFWGGTRAPYLEWASEMEKDTIFGRDFSFPRSRNVLSVLMDRCSLVLVDLALASGQVDVNLADTKRARTPLSWAAEKGDEAVVQLLLDRGAATEAVDNSGRTPLSWAAEKGHEAVVQLLLDRGAALGTVDKSSRTPLSWATANGHEAVIHLLLDRGATIEKVNILGQMAWLGG